MGVPLKMRLAGGFGKGGPTGECGAAGRGVGQTLDAPGHKVARQVIGHAGTGAVEVVTLDEVAVGVIGLMTGAGPAAGAGRLGTGGKTGNAGVLGSLETDGAAVGLGDGHAGGGDPVMGAGKKIGGLIISLGNGNSGRGGVVHLIAVDATGVFGGTGTSLIVVTEGGVAGAGLVDDAGQGPGEIGTLVEEGAGGAVGPGEGATGGVLDGGEQAALRGGFCNGSTVREIEPEVIQV